MNSNEIVKRIVNGELILTKAIWEGHRPYYGDKYETVRTEVGVLRCLHYGEDSKYCNSRYKK